MITFRLPELIAVVAVVFATGAVFGVVMARPSRRQREEMRRLRGLAMLLNLRSQQRAVERKQARGRAQVTGRRYLEERLRMVQALKKGRDRG